MLRAQRPRSNVAISGFSNSFADPFQLASFWGEVLGASGIDLLLFQDGVGEGKVALEDIALYYQPLEREVAKAGSRLGAVVELFSLLPNGRRVPATISRIREQMNVAEPLTSYPLVAFSIPDYMSSFAGPQAAQLLSNYLAAQKACSR